MAPVSSHWSFTPADSFCVDVLLPQKALTAIGKRAENQVETSIGLSGSSGPTFPDACTCHFCLLPCLSVESGTPAHIH